MTSEKPNPAIKFGLPGSEKVNPKLPKSPDLELRYSKFQWFSTAIGRRTVGSVFALASLGVTLIKVSPHTYCLRYVRDVYQHHSRGLPTKISDEIKNLLGEVSDDIGLTGEEKKQVKAFVTTETEPYGWGGLSSGKRGYGALLAYPNHFHYNDPVEVPIDKMRFGIHATGSSTSLTGSALASDEAKTLCKSLVLSKEAKKFALAREIERTRDNSFIFKSILPGSWLFLTYLIARHANKKLGLFKAPFRPIHRGIAYISLLPTMTLSYFVTKDWHERVVQGRTDAAVAGLSVEYAKGGVEYYNKLLQRNVCMRELQPKGKKMYNLHGELLQGIIRVKHKPLLERKAVCEGKLASFAVD